MDISEINSSSIFRHPWEISRAKSILSLVRGGLSAGPFADIGAGDLYFANQLKEASNSVVCAVDLGYKSFLPENTSALTIYDDIGRLNKNEFGAVFLLDVLEHNDDEAGLLRRLSSILRHGGKLIVTVPAFQFLFTEHDIALAHKRRYSKHQLKNVMSNAGYEIEEVFYFFFMLFFARAVECGLSILGGGSFSKKAVSSWKYPESSLITRIVILLLDVDFHICRILSKFKISIPGLSLCAICKKTSS